MIFLVARPDGTIEEANTRDLPEPGASAKRQNSRRDRAFVAIRCRSTFNPYVPVDNPYPNLIVVRSKRRGS